jgi:hypothetical protein
MTSAVVIVPRVRPELIESLRALSEHGRGVGGEYALGVGFLLAAIGSSTQTRLLQRNAAIVLN